MKRRPKHAAPAGDASILPISFEPDLDQNRQEIALPDKNPTPLSRLPHTVGTVFFLYILFEIVGMPRPFAWFTFFFVLILVAVVSQAVMLRRRSQDDGSPLPGTLIGARVRACGRPQTLRRLLPLESHMFEPVIVTQGTKGWTWLVALIVAALAFFAIRKALPALAPNSARAPYYAYGALFAIFPVIAWGLSRVRPIYYRVAPGQLDVLCFHFMSGRADLLQRIDLRGSKVEVAVSRAMIRFDPPDAAPTEISLMNVSEPLRFAQAVLSGAISTQPTPPLPHDALLG